MVRSTIGWKWGRICPCERNSGNQSVRVRSSSVSAEHRQRLLVGEPHGEQARALGDRQRLDDGLQPLVPARSGQQQSFHGDIARGGLRGEVLDLVEHGRPVREQSHAIHGGGGRGHRPEDRLKRRESLLRRARRSHLRGRASTGAPNARAPFGACPLDVELVGEMRQHDPLGPSPARRARRPPRASDARAGRRAPAAAASPRSAAGRCRRRTRTAPRWARSRRRR